MNNPADNYPDPMKEPDNKPAIRSILDVPLNRRGFMFGVGATAAGMAANYALSGVAYGQSEQPNKDEDQQGESREIDITDESTWVPEFLDLKENALVLKNRYWLNPLDTFTVSLLEKNPDFFDSWGVEQDSLMYEATMSSSVYSDGDEKVLPRYEEDPEGKIYVDKVKSVRNGLTGILPHLVLTNDAVSVSSDGQLISSNSIEGDISLITSEFDPKNPEELLMNYIRDAQIIFDEYSYVVRQYCNPTLTANYYAELYGGMTKILDVWTSLDISLLNSVRELDKKRKPLLEIETLESSYSLKDIMSAVTQVENYFSIELSDQGYYPTDEIPGEIYTDNDRLNAAAHFLFKNVRANSPEAVDIKDQMADKPRIRALLNVVQDALYRQLSGPMMNLKYGSNHMPQSGLEHQNQAVSDSDVFSVVHEKVERARFMIPVDPSVVNNPDIIDMRVQILRELGDEMYEQS